MARFELLVKPSVWKDVRRMPKADLVRVLGRLDALRDDPRPPACARLSGAEYYRLRQGDYRIVYEIDDAHSQVIVLKVGHRSDVYR